MRRSACRAPGSIAQPASWPWVVATTRAAPGRAQGRREQPERRRRAEPHRGAAEVAQGGDGSPPHRRRGQQQAGRVPQHRERLRGVERGRPRVVGGVDDQRARRLADRELVHEGLDAALARREVVGDEQRAAASLIRVRASRRPATAR